MLRKRQNAPPAQLTRFTRPGLDSGSVPELVEGLIPDFGSVPEPVEGLIFDF
jgi:hypothetical protein